MGCTGVVGICHQDCYGGTVGIIGRVIIIIGGLVIVGIDIVGFRNSWGINYGDRRDGQRGQRRVQILAKNVDILGE